MNANKLITLAAVAASAAIPLAANAAYTRVTQTIDGIDWQLQLDPETGSATLGYGGSFNASAYACPDVPLNAANIPWTFIGDDGIRYTVTKIAQAAFSSHEKLIGVLTIPDSVTTIERNAFAGCTGLTELKGCRNVKQWTHYIFSRNSNMTGTYPDMSSVTSIKEGPFQFCTSMTGKLILGDSLLTLDRLALAQARYSGKVWYYGPSEAFDLAVNDADMTATFTPTTVNALTNALSWASDFKTHFNLDTHISVTNTLDLTGVTITPAMASGVTFDRLMFSAKTQAQLDNILDAFPASTPFSIDPTGLTENMVIPDTYSNVFVKTVPGVTIKRTTNGFMIIVK